MKTGKILIVILVLVCLLCPYSIFASGENPGAEPEGFDGYVALSDGEVRVLRQEEVNGYDAAAFEMYEKEHTVYQVTRQGETKTYLTYAEAMDDVMQTKTWKAAARAIAEKDVQLIEKTLTYGTDVGVVIFKNTSSTLTYANKNTGAETYIAPSYAPDAAYLGISGNTITFRQAGCTGTVSADNAYVMTYDDFKKAGYVTSVYRVKNGKLYHYITTDLKNYSSYYTVGYRQPYMTEGAEYYSFDGHYFYASYEQMARDYIANTHAGAINPATPYYNYYQYLSHRTQTVYTADQINNYIASRTADTSKLRNTGAAFIEYQNTYGSNAILMFGLSVNESGWGTSQIARDKNNLFGHGAVDSNPYYGANGYASPADSIRYHAQYFVSRGYLDPTDFRYFGPHLGDKNSGMNVKYASDPYWGEKAASQAYLLNEFYGNYSDINRYTILICDGDQKIYKYTAASNYFYSTGNGSKPYPTLDFPFTVQQTVIGEFIGGSETWYQIATDPDLKDDRTGFIIRPDGTYHPQNSYGYVHASQVRTIIPSTKNPRPPQPPTPVKFRGGDVNNDGAVDTKDSVLFSRYLAKWAVQIDIKQADLNENGDANSTDLMILKRYLAKWPSYIRIE